MFPYTVLVIDDTPFIRRLASDLLSRSDIKVLKASSGTQGLEMARSHRPDLILLDRHMDDMDGHEVLKELKSDEDTAPMPIAMLTGETNKQEIMTSLSLGAVDYIIKPFQIQTLIKKVDKLLERYASPFAPQKIQS